MRRLLLSVFLIAVFTTPVFADNASMPIDEFAAHRHARMLQDMIVCLGEHGGSMDMDSRETLDYSWGTGLASSYTDAMIAAGASGYRWDHYQDSWLMQRQDQIMTDICEEIVTICEDLLDTDCADEWMLSMDELDIIDSIRLNALLAIPRISNIDAELGRTYVCRNYDYIRQELNRIDTIQSVLLADVTWLMAPANLNCPE